MSPRWTTRLEARLGPEATELRLVRRLPWRGTAALWQGRFDGAALRDEAPAALDHALSSARAALAAQRLPWPRRLGLQIDDAWVQHACLRGEFYALGTQATHDAARHFLAKALATPPDGLAVVTLPQPDGRSMWASCLPQPLHDALAESARRAGLSLATLQPSAQAWLGGQARRWPGEGVLALSHARGVLLALRRGGSWIALAQEHRPFDSAVALRALALGRFHGVVLKAGAQWAVTPAGTPLLPGWEHAGLPCWEAMA